MSGKALLPVRLKVPLAVIDDNFVVHALASEVFLVGMHRGVGNRVHVRLGDVFGDHRYTKLPNKDLFVIGCRDEAPAILYEG